jgi:cob(I)alamin adenosyltransferase
LKIYTKTGDKGETSLFGGKRVTKDSLRIEAYGTVDELNSLLGVCRAFNTVEHVDTILEELQHDLFTLGADLATPFDVQSASVRRIQSSDIEQLEHHIDALESNLDSLKSFILPGGNKSAALLHYARTVCRRAERCVTLLSKQENIGEQPLVYLNRLSDLLFVMARWVNSLNNIPETKWKK